MCFGKDIRFLQVTPFLIRLLLHGEVFLSLASESFPVFSGKQVIAGAVGLCEFPHSWIPEPLWLRAQDNPPSSPALAQLQVQCPMKQQQRIPAFISPALRDICCIIFDMSGANHQSAPLPPGLLPLQQHGLLYTANEVQSVNGGCVQTWPCPR